MKLNFLLLSLLLFSLNSFAKPTDSLKVHVPNSLRLTEKESDTTVSDTMLVYWSEKNTFGVNLTEVAFVNWNSGGNNSVSALFLLEF